MGRLRHDIVIWVTVAVLVILVGSYSLPILTEDQIYLLSESYASPILLVLLIWALCHGLRRIDHIEERRFWTLLAVGFSCWLSGALLQNTSETVTASHWFETAVDSLFLLSYLACILAVDQRPHSASGWSRGNLPYAFSALGTLLFVCGIVCYFFLIPYAFRFESEMQFPTWYLIIALDGLLAVRFAYLAVGCRDRWWRGAYITFALVSMMWILTDSIECAMSLGLVEIPYGKAWDILWLAPFPIIATVRRLRRPASGTVPMESTLGDISRHLDLHEDTPKLLLLYAFLFPTFHLALYASGVLEGESRNMREALVLVCLIAFVALAVSQQWLLAKRNKELRSEITVLVSNEKIQQAQKMEAVGRLAGGVAHDFNNLLAVIRGRASLLLLSLRPEDPLYSDAAEIEKASQRGSELTRQLLTFSRDQVVQPKIVDINTVLSQSRIMLRRLLGETIQVETRLADDLGTVSIDPSQLLQVVLNLSVNARDAMPEGGFLTFSTFNVELDGREADLLPLPAAGSYVALSVIDTGLGMDDTTRSRVFEPFFSRRKCGTGLGLATVYGIVQQGGGCVRVDSVAGHGTTFTVYLPKAEGEPEPAEEPVQKEIALKQGSATVLLVEDERDVRETVRELLDECGYEILEAESAEEAMEIFLEDPGRIDVLVTDIVMPGMDGWSLGRRLRDQRSGLPVLYMSGYTDGTAGTDTDLGQGELFLQKPFNLVAFAEAVQSLEGGSADGAVS